MFKLYKKLKPLDWILIGLIVAFTVGQVYCTMTMVDFVSGIIKSITYLNYHNNPDLLGETFYNMFTTTMNSDWTILANMSVQTLTSLGVSADMAGTMHSIATASTGDIWYNAGMMVLLALGTASCQAIISIIASYVAADLSTNIRRDLNAKVSSFSLEEINKFSTASLITRTTNDIQQVQMANLLMMRMVFAAPITAIWAICKIQASSFELTVATGITIIILIASIACIMLFVMPKFKSMQKIIDRVNGITRENLTGIRVVRAYNAEEYQEDKFNIANDKLTKTQLFTGRVLNLMSPIMMILMNGLSLAIYWIGAILVNKGQIDFGTITSFVMLATQIIMAFMMLMMMFIFWPRASVSAKRINEVLDTNVSVVDPQYEIKPVEEGTVEFKDVSFKYPGGEADVINDISFKAKKGDTIAFIGATGSGKSTIINLVSRLYDATKGQVLVDGVDVRNMKQKTLRGLIGYVPQKGILMSGTVKSNIAFGNPSIDDKQIVKAAKIAEADEFVTQMENGYDSEISQGGKNVSGGQKQRLCIARAVAINPQIMIFDDSFSALDYKTDRKVRDNLKEFAPGITKLIVAQRIGTIMDADEIVVLSDGKAVGVGTHEELLRSCPIYRDIALSQLSREELGL